MSNSLVAFKRGTQAQFDALVEKDVDTLYFCTDTQRIYKGSVEYTKSAIVVNNVPSVSEGVFGRIYVCTADNIPRVFTGSGYTELIRPYTQQIVDNHGQVPTSKAVKDYVDTANSNNITGLSYSSNTLNVYKNNSQSPSTTVSFNGMAHDPSYVQATRTITIPIVGGQDLVISLGVDSVVSSGSYNNVTHNLELVLTSGDTVYVPVGDLVDEYTAGTTATIILSCDANNQFTGTVKISSATGNALQANNDGLYVPSSSGESYDFLDSDTVKFDVDELNHVEASVIVAPTTGNVLQSTPTGLYVPASSGSIIWTDISA